MRIQQTRRPSNSQPQTWINNKKGAYEQASFSPLFTICNRRLSLRSNNLLQLRDLPLCYDHKMGPILQQYTICWLHCRPSFAHPFKPLGRGFRLSCGHPFRSGAIDLVMSDPGPPPPCNKLNYALFMHSWLNVYNAWFSLKLKWKVKSKISVLYTFILFLYPLPFICFVFLHRNSCIYTLPWM